MRTGALKAAARKAQQGLVLFVALIVLVAMSLAGIALLRGVDTGTIIAGNLAFRQAAMHVGDVGVEAARTYLLGVTPAASLYNDNTGAGYYANWAENAVLVGTAGVGQTQFDWGTAVNVTTPAPPAGYTVSYVIHRMCKESAFDPTATTCVKQTGVASSTGGGTKGAAAFGTMAIQVPTNAVYRITVRVLGPRNSTSFIQAVVF